MTWHSLVFLTSLLAAGAALVASSYVVFLAIVGRSSKYESGISQAEGVPRTHFLVLIPAHNEEEGIGPTLESFRMQDYPAALLRVVVVADNCKDATATVVRSAGFECWERNSTANPGKGQALRWALDQVESEDCDAVAFVDADTRIDGKFLFELDGQIQNGVSVIQTRYEFELADQSYFSLLTYASKRAENTLFWRPRERFSWMGFIGGNGFCIKREVLKRVPWEAYTIVEDVEYSMQLAMRGVRVKFLEETSVVSRATRRAKDAAPQRLRWASGTFRVMASYVPRLIRRSFETRSFKLLEMALALSLTSRMFLIYLICLAIPGCFLLGNTVESFYLRCAVAASILFLCVYAALVLSEVPSYRGSRLRSFITLPCYLIWMLLIHVAATFGLQRGVWARTTR